MMAWVNRGTREHKGQSSQQILRYVEVCLLKTTSAKKTEKVAKDLKMEYIKINS